MAAIFNTTELEERTPYRDRRGDQIILAFANRLVGDLKRRAKPGVMDRIESQIHAPHGDIQSIHICFHEDHSPTPSYRFVVSPSTRPRAHLWFRMETYEHTKGLHGEWSAGTPKDVEVHPAIDLVELALSQIRRRLLVSHSYHRWDCCSRGSTTAPR
jgi:hypothetical protein